MSDKNKVNQNVSHQDRYSTNLLKSLKQPSKSAIDYLLSYLAIDSQSDPTSGQWPSTEKQKDMCRQLVQDFADMGITAEMTEDGYVYASLPSNTTNAANKLGLIAHVDTSPDMSGANVRPGSVLYEGGPITLNADQNIILEPDTFPNLLPHIGQDLLVTDGTTLLGVDDKAGVAAIVALAAYLQANPELPHGELRFGFTPDEEIGTGAHRFDVARFDADVAYTMDGGREGEYEFESFNAAGAVVKVKGRNVHPGTAKDKMINATLVAREYSALFDRRDTPEHTEGFEGFYHLMEWNSTVESAKLNYIIRDFDRPNFEKRKQAMLDAAEQINAQYGAGTVTVEIKDQYYNMREIVEQYPFMIELAEQAMHMTGVTPVQASIRGGTDGSQLSYMGLPCPNLWVGGENFHGRYEFLNIQTFYKAIEMLIHLVKLYGEKE